MNVLFVSALLPYPLYSGGQVRIYNLLKLLSRKHTITLYTFLRDHQEAAYIPKLPFLHRIEYVHRGIAMQPSYIVRSILGKYPLLLSSYTNAILRDRIHKELRKNAYDLIHIEPFYVWPSVPEAEIPLVVGEHNIEYQVYERYVALSIPHIIQPLFTQDIKKIRYWERYVWSKASHITAVSQSDADIIRNSISTKTVSIVPNGVDIHHYLYKTRSFCRFEASFLFVGNFSWLPNVEAVTVLLQQIWPEVLKAIPTAKLTIIGSRMSTRIQQYTHQNGILIKERVADIRKEYYQSHALLSPISIAGGTKFKLLEAMACGTPIISTREAFVGLDVIPGYHTEIAQKSGDFVEQICDLYRHPSRWITMTERARSHIEKHYDWRNIADTLSHIWEQTQYIDRQ